MDIKEIEEMVNTSTEQERKERQKIAEKIGNLINEIKPFTNAIDSEVIGTHLYEVGYGIVEDYKKEIEILKDTLQYMCSMNGFELSMTKLDSKHIEYSCNGYVVDKQTYEYLMQAKKLIRW